MEDSDVLDEIKVKAEQCAQCIKKYGLDSMNDFII